MKRSWKTARLPPLSECIVKRRPLPWRWVTQFFRSSGSDSSNLPQKEKTAKLGAREKPLCCESHPCGAGEVSRGPVSNGREMLDGARVTASALHALTTVAMVPGGGTGARRSL